MCFLESTILRHAGFSINVKTLRQTSCRIVPRELMGNPTKITAYLHLPTPLDLKKPMGKTAGFFLPSIYMGHNES